jgi:hypothetical protein
VTHDFFFGSSAPFTWNAFWWLFRQGLSFLYVWPMLLITLAVVANLVAALIFRWPFQNELWKKDYWPAFLTLLLIPATTAIGVLGWIDPSVVPRPQPSALLVWTNNGLFIASIAFGIFWVYRMKGLRWFALSFMLIQLWILMGVGFIAGMALSGDWL